VGIVNPGQDAFMGSDTAGTNATYFLSDGVHYATKGRQRMAQVFYAPAFHRARAGETGFIINGQALTHLPLLLSRSRTTQYLRLDE